MLTCTAATRPARLPGGWVSNASVQTTLSGGAAVTGRPGLAVGQYGVQASFDDIHGDAIPGSGISFAGGTNGTDMLRIIGLGASDVFHFAPGQMTHGKPT